MINNIVIVIILYLKSKLDILPIKILKMGNTEDKGQN